MDVIRVRILTRVRSRTTGIGPDLPVVDNFLNSSATRKGDEVSESLLASRIQIHGTSLRMQTPISTTADRTTVINLNTTSIRVLEVGS